MCVSACVCVCVFYSYNINNCIPETERFIEKKFQQYFFSGLLEAGDEYLCLGTVFLLL